ncbi:MAG: AEC family transporter [Lachnospiraceae bacterium]|nr:AEC family transporter [Lachnospiraceae bacterium]
MLQSFQIVGTQVLVLFVLIVIGFFCGKKKLLSGQAIRGINDLVLYLVNPCVIVHAFQREFNISLLRGFLFALLAAVIAHGLCLILSFLIFRMKKAGEDAGNASGDENRIRVLRFATVFSNCGFMALPLLDALAGADGVFYGAAYLTVFNLLIWSYGQYSMAKGTDGFSAKKVLLNPSIISVFIGLILFFTSTTLPDLIALPIGHMAALNTPVPMIIIGYTIANLDLKHLFGPADEFLVYLFRLIVSPLLLLGILYLIGLRGTLLVSCIVSASAPVAGLTTMFSIKYGRDTSLSSRLVATSTLLSILTMTLIVGIAQYLS